MLSSQVGRATPCGVSVFGGHVVRFILTRTWHGTGVAHCSLLLPGARETTLLARRMTNPAGRVAKCALCVQCCLVPPRPCSLSLVLLLNACPDQHRHGSHVHPLIDPLVLPIRRVQRQHSNMSNIVGLGPRFFTSQKVVSPSPDADNNIRTSPSLLHHSGPCSLLHPPVLSPMYNKHAHRAAPLPPAS